MSLGLHIIGPQETGIIDVFEFFPGEDRTLKLQVYDQDSGQKVQVSSTATKTLTLAGTPSNLVIANGSITVDTSDRSIFTVSLSAAQTALLISGTIEFLFVDTSVTRIATKPFGLSKLVVGV